MDLTEKVADQIGYRLAAMVSRNNMPDMSGDPRNRIQPAMRRQFDKACEDAARAAIAVCAEEMARLAEQQDFGFEYDIDPGETVGAGVASKAIAAAIRSMGEKGE